MLRITLFGTTSVTEGSVTAPPINLGGVKPRQILEILALAAGTPVAKDRLADLLWGGSPPRSYVGTLESYVSLLRRRLGCRQPRSSAITTTSRGYVLDPAQVTVDLVECRSLFRKASEADPLSAVQHVRRAVHLSSWPLLGSEPYADWAAQERRLFHQELIGACVRGSSCAAVVGDDELAVALARRAVALDPLAEHACQQLMRALHGAGRKGEALRSYAEQRSVMLDELGIEPSEATHALYLDILRDESQGPGDGGGPAELQILLTLLRQALDSLPGVQPTKGDSGLSYVAAKVLSAA